MSFNDIVRVCSLINVTKTNSMFYELQNNTPSVPTLSSGGTASSYEGWYISRVQYSSYIMLNTFQRCPQKKRNVLSEDDTRLCGYRRGGRRQKKKSILLGAIYLIVAVSYHGIFFPLSPNMLVMSIPFKLISYR